MTRSTTAALLLTLTLAGCEQTPENKVQTDTTEQFKLAEEHLDLAQTALPTDVSVRRVEWRQGELAEAVKILATIQDQGTPLQQSATKSLLAEAEKSKAMNEIRLALAVWNEQSSRARRLVSVSNEAGTFRAAAQSHEAIDLNDELVAARKIESDQLAERDELAQKVASLQSTVKDLEGKIATATQSRRERLAKAEDLNRRAFAAKGQEQFDLYKQGYEEVAAADKLTAERESLESRLDVARAELNVARTKLDFLTAGYDETKRTVESLRFDDPEALDKLNEFIAAQGQAEKPGETPKVGRLARSLGAVAALQYRIARNKALAADATASYEKALAEFDEGFKTLTATQAEQVHGGFERALEMMDAATQQSLAASTNDTAATAQVELGARKLMKAYLLGELRLIDLSYRGSLEGMAAAIEPVDPAKAAAVKEAAEAAAKRFDETTAATKQAFADAIEGLEAAVNTARTAQDAVSERAALRMQIAGLQTQAGITGEEPTRVEELRTRLSQLP